LRRRNADFGSGLSGLSPLGDWDDERTAVRQAVVAAGKGWYLRLMKPGEKVVGG
jgi:hypothetical protein